ncbi:hypothetical protein ACFOMD_01685 [Sphingoaurantiacus capsulatus]|uniref:Uncharacterized protein n=1 Tax=Sphingoaurantiacus capsulatus TaxID=1771310 RepID=A0ABV7X7N0_9SPHN
MSTYLAAAAAALLTLTSTVPTKNQIIAMINAGLSGQGEEYDILSIRVRSANPSAKGDDGWICGSFTGNLADGTPVEARSYIANHAEMRIVFLPAKSFEGSDTYVEEQDEFFAAYEQLC